MKKILILIAVVAVGAFAWWTISPLFIDKVVEDELSPELAALLETETVTPPPAPELSDTSAITIESGTTLTGSETTVTEVEQPRIVPPPVVDTPTASPAAETSSPAPGATPTSFVEGPFPIVDTPGHGATGDIRLIRTPDETIVRYENYDGTNGPDLKVYLTNDLDATEFVNLGTAKGNQGNINYTVPSNVDIDEYKYVMTWCEAFGVLFDYAQIN